MTLGEYIRTYREKMHMSQRQFAEKSGVSNGYISMLEKNENPKTGQPLSPSLPVMKKMAAAMGVTVNELCACVDDMAIDDGTTVLGYDEAQEKLRIILTEEEFTMLRAFQAADQRARADALSLLGAHPAK